MKNRKKWRIVLFILATVLYILRVVQVNADFSKVYRVEVYQMNDMLTDMGLEIRVQEMTQTSFAALKEMYSDSRLFYSMIENQEDTGNDVYFITLELYNPTAEAIRYEMGTVEMQTRYWSSPNLDVFCFATGQENRPVIQPGERKLVKNLYVVPYGQYGKYITGEDLYLSFRLGPEKKMVLLKSV